MKKNEEETLEENADETGGLTKEELDEIMADGGMMSRSGGNRRSAPKSNPKQNLKKEPKQKKLRRVLLIVFLVFAGHHRRDRGICVFFYERIPG